MVWLTVFRSIVIRITDGIFILRQIQQISKGMRKLVFYLVFCLALVIVFYFFTLVVLDWFLKSINLLSPKLSGKIMLMKIRASLYQDKFSNFQILSKVAINHYPYLTFIETLWFVLLMKVVPTIVKSSLKL